MATKQKQRQAKLGKGIARLEKRMDAKLGLTTKKFTVRCRRKGQTSTWKLDDFNAVDKTTANFKALHKLEERGIKDETEIVSIRKAKI